MSLKLDFLIVDPPPLISRVCYEDGVRREMESIVLTSSLLGREDGPGGSQENSISG